MLTPFFKSSVLEAGTDEAGRGCLAGPVVAAAVILPSGISNPSVLSYKGNNHAPIFNAKKVIKSFDSSLNNDESITFFLQLINDSKQLSEKTRIKLQPIIEKIAVSFAVSFQDAAIIDEINILNASLEAMRESILNLKVIPIYITLDGNQPLTPCPPVNKGEFRTGMFHEIEYSCIVKGDSKYMNIAAASILAKTYRDMYMDKIHEEFPMYNWKRNKGYPTKEHREAIREFGVTKYHRTSFRWLPEMSNLEIINLHAL